jgi:DNA-binding beta-propeller fold protein YncE
MAVGVLLCAVAWALFVSGGIARGAITHEYLPGVSRVLEEGVPANAAAPALTGPLNSISGLAVDSGHVWIADKSGAEGIEDIGRIDEFDSATGGFLAPQLQEEQGVSVIFDPLAIGHSDGGEQVYVVAKKAGEGVVAVFENGHVVGSWTGANTPSGSFTGANNPGGLHGVAVAGAGSFETAGDVYVAAPEAVDVFKPDVGGQEPAKIVGQLHGSCAVEGTTCPGKEIPFSEVLGMAVSGFDGDVLVSDGQKVDVFAPAGLGEYEFVRQLTGTPAGPFDRIARGNGVAVDPSDGDIYVADTGAGAVYEFDSEGVFLGRLTGIPSRSFVALALAGVGVDGSGQVYVGENNEKKGDLGSVDVFGANVWLPDVEVVEPVSGFAFEEAASGASIAVKLKGMLNPDGKGEATCEFEFGLTRAYGERVPCTAPVGEGNARVPVESQQLNGLAPDTTYYYRLDGTNVADGQTNTGQGSEDEGEFTTPGPALGGASVSDVSDESATLDGTVNPNGAPASYYFQYGTSSEYSSQTPLMPGQLGAGKAGVEVARRLQGLTANAVYHYRLVVISEVSSGKEVLFASPDLTFTTQRTGSALLLPDGREWELVSPVDKHGSLIRPITEAGVAQSSTVGDAITYVASRPTAGDGARGFSEYVQGVSERGTDGWSSRDVSLPHSNAVGTTTADGPEFKFFSSDLSQWLVEPQGPYTSLEPEVFPPDTERTPYVRHDSMCVTTSSECYEPLVTGASGYADVPEGTKFGGTQLTLGEVQFSGATPDLSHVIVSSPTPLTETKTGSANELYEWSAGNATGDRMALVSVLPEAEGGKPATGDTALGFRGFISRHAVSEDGSLVAFLQLGGHLYLRDTATKRTTLLDDVQQGASGTGGVGPVFQTASAEMSRVFFTDSQQLTPDSGSAAGGPDLYECDITVVAEEPQCALSDLTPVSHSGEAADVQGAIIGSSEDGSWVYFVANGVLGETAKEGALPGKCHENKSAVGATCNLYALHYGDGAWGAPKLVAVISGDDFPDWAGDGGDNLVNLTGRVSPDGEWLAFMSDRPLTGYDNRDALSGKPDEEVYLYHASTGRLVCASCDPTGARPAGVEYLKIDSGLAGGNHVWENGDWIAANIPGWTPFNALVAQYQSRYLSDSGRLFFNSSDALAPQDINHNEDVYEYEPPGVGDCEETSATFSVRSVGCVSLISSGTAAGESAFLDASETGDDVFFLTGEKLASEDVDTAVDVYDAHVCSDAAPCQAEASAPPPCTTADACRTAPEQQPAIFGAPASATFTGQGNTATSPPVAVVKAKTKPLTRAQKLARAFAVCKKKAKQKRGVCERQARKRYGAKAARRSAGSVKSVKRGGR